MMWTLVVVSVGLTRVDTCPVAGFVVLAWTIVGLIRSSVVEHMLTILMTWSAVVVFVLMDSAWTTIIAMLWTCMVLARLTIIVTWLSLMCAWTIVIVMLWTCPMSLVLTVAMAWMSLMCTWTIIIVMLSIGSTIRTSWMLAAAWMFWVLSMFTAMLATFAILVRMLTFATVTSMDGNRSLTEEVRVACLWMNVHGRRARSGACESLRSLHRGVRAALRED